MCGRMSLSRDELQEVARELEATVPPEAATLYRPHWNIAPTARCFVLRAAPDHRRELVPAIWGMSPRGRGLVVNARAESLATNGLWRRALRESRCLVPADGFFEWTGAARDRRPIWFHAPDGKLLLFAGLFHENDETGDVQFTIVTTPANDVVGEVHDRMPAMVARDQIDRWLSQPASELLVPAPAAWLVGREVSKRANSAENDDPSVLGPPEAAAAVQLKLV